MALKMENILMNFMENKLMIFIIADDSPLLDEILGQKEALGEFIEMNLVVMNYRRSIDEFPNR